MSEEQIKEHQRMQNKDEQRIMLLSEKYGRENKIDYRKKKENKLLGLFVVIIILLILIVLAILINV